MLATAPATSHAPAPVHSQSDEVPASEPDPDELIAAAHPHRGSIELEQGDGIRVGIARSTEADVGVGRVRSEIEMDAANEDQEQKEEEMRRRQGEEEVERERRLKDDVRRFYALAELVDTERAYVRDLRVLVEIYLSSLGALPRPSPIGVPGFNGLTPDSTSPSTSVAGLPPTSTDPVAHLSTAKKARRSSQPAASQEFVTPDGLPGAASMASSSAFVADPVATAEDTTLKGKGKRGRRMSLGSLSLGRGPSTPSTPPSDAPSSSHYIPHSQTPGGRTSTESTRAAQAHLQAVITHRHSVDVAAPSKLQKKSRPRQGHVRTQSASSIASCTVGFAPGLTPGFGGIIPPSSFAPHRGRLSAELSTAATGRTWTPSPSPSRTNSLPLLSTIGSSTTTAPVGSTFSESPSSSTNSKPFKQNFLRSAHASGITLALSEAERRILARSAVEVLALHEHLVRRIDAALRDINYFESLDCPENVEEAVKAVCRVFSSEAKQGSFRAYEDFCAGHTEALDAVRRLSRLKHTEWVEWERRCKSEGATLLLGEDAVASPSIADRLSDEPERYEPERRMAFDLSNGIDDDAPLVPPDRSVLLGNHDARSSTSTLRERRRHSASASTLELELGLGAKSSIGSLRAGKSTALKHTKSDPTSGEKNAGAPQRMASRASLKMSSVTIDATKRMSKIPDPNSPSRASFNHERDSRQGAEKERQALMKLGFADYLIKPIQRVCKYPLLFEQLRASASRKRNTSRHASRSESPRVGERRHSRASFTLADEDFNESDDEDDNDVDIGVFVEKTMLSMREVTRAVDEARRKRDIEVKSRLIVDRIIAGNPNSPVVVLSMEGDGSADESSHGHSEFGHGYNAPPKVPTRSLSFSSAFSRSRSRISGLNHAADSEHGHGQGQGIVNVMGRLLLAGPPSRVFLDSLGACLLAGTLDVVVRDLSHLKVRVERSKRDSMLSMSSMSSSASRSNNASVARTHATACPKEPVKVKYLAAFLYVGGYVLLVKTMKAGVYATRHWFSLADEGVEVVDVSEDEALLPCSFHLIFHATGHRLELAAACQREKMLWLQAIASARTIRPTWECEPVPTLSVSAPPGHRASMDISDTDVPPVPSVPSTLNDMHVHGIPLKPSSSTLKTEATVRPRGAGPDRRQSLTGSTVRALFSYGAGHGADLASFAPSTVLIRRVSATRRAQTDRLLADVLSEPLLAARLHAKSHDEVLFRDPEPLHGAGVGMGTMAKNRLMGRESVLVSTHCPKSAPPSASAFAPERPSAMTASTSEMGVLRQGAAVARALTLKGKRSFSRKSFGMRLTLPDSLQEVDTVDSQPPSTCQSPASPASPMPMSTSSQGPHSQPQRISELSHNVQHLDIPPTVRVVGTDSPQPPILELPDIVDPEDRPKRARSLIDNVKGFFVPRSVSPSPSPTPSLSLSTSSKQPSFDGSKEKEGSNVLSRIWKSTTLRSRARSTTEMSTGKNGVHKSTSQKRPRSPARTPSAPVSRRSSFLSRSSTLLSRRLSAFEFGVDIVQPSPSSSRIQRRASITPGEIRYRPSTKRLSKRRSRATDLAPLTQIRVENS